MPQLDPAVWPTQLIWLAITFIACYLVIWRIALPRIADVLEARQRKLDDDLKKATALKEEAETILAEYEKMRADAQASAHSVLQKAQDEMKAEAERQNSEVAAKLAKQTEEAEARIAEAKTAALSSLEGTVNEVVAAATEKLIGVKAGDQEIARAVTEVMGGKR
ncbi:F0F1 ATP synthase subunit B family protein [Pelagibius marinus]|uniref:F0F1 ATP synthase subunit B family protein n=1 Tax=Pelagibius marinus TaxID=2762760 RepID=UPI001872501E|nr:F0F1 ATP synthase subunit B' [Pelagibius marinus]